MTEASDKRKHSATPVETGLIGRGEWTQQAVPPGCACPGCKEWLMDLLVWIDNDQVRCTSCGTIYKPAASEVDSRDEVHSRGELPSQDEARSPGEIHSRDAVQTKGSRDARDDATG